MVIEIELRIKGNEVIVTASGDRSQRPPPHSLGAELTVVRLEAFAEKVGSAIRRAARFDESLVDEARRIHEALFQDELRDVLASAKGGADGAPLLRLMIRDRALQAIPWEALCRPGTSEEFLATGSRFPVVRGVNSSEVCDVREVKGAVRVLAVAPTGDAGLDVLRGVLQGSIDAGLIEWLPPITGEKAGVTRLFGAMREGRVPHVIHFLGHGGVDSEGHPTLRLADDEFGDEVWRKAETLAQELSASFGDELRLVVLEACEGARPGSLGSAAELIAKAGARAAVAYLWPVKADAARLCSTEFYRALTVGTRTRSNVVASLNAARRTLLGESAEGFSPVVYLRGEDPVLFDFGRSGRSSDAAVHAPTRGASPVDARGKELSAEHLSISQLPVPMGKTFLGRDKELARLDECWSDPDTRVVSIVAMGGAGKSALVDAWLKGMLKDGWRGAERVYGWSFYSQGSSDIGSGDTFIAHALRWFGHTGEIPVSAWDRGELLARLVKQQKTLLVLDGLEPLQAPPGPDAGKLRDHGVAALVRELAAGGSGLCVISSRLVVADLVAREDGAAPKIDLEELSPEDGAKLLNALEVKGSTEELEEAARELKGHALALTLLGSYLADACHGDVRQRKEIGPLELYESGGERAKRVMAAYVRWLGDGREVAVLRLLGLFDRPADEGCLRALRAEPPIAKLTEKLIGLNDLQWNQTVTKLRRAHLVADITKGEPGGIDAHPLVREYFGARLREEAPEAGRAGHGRLFEHLQKVAPEFPEDTVAMAPLYAAVVHGCHAGRPQEALDEVLSKRVYRGKEFFNTKKLSAFGAQLGMTAAFFDPPWIRVAPGLTEASEAFVLNEAGITLRALGRLDEATKPTVLGLEKRLAQEHWENAARVASNLSQLHLARGAVDEAVEEARRSVELADRSGDTFQRVANGACLADALHQAGRLDEARTLFKEAEALQKEWQPTSPLLYSLQGFIYNDFLLGLGLIEDVSNRARSGLKISIRNRWRLSIALDHLSLGRAVLAQTLRNPSAELTPARTKLDEAMTALREAGMQDFLVRGLLARAELHLATHDLPAAEQDLNEALLIATRGGMRLFEADAHLGFTRLHLARGDHTTARASFTKAKDLIERTGYHRRDPDLAALEAALTSTT